MTEAYDGRQVVGMDLHRRRSVLVRMTEDGRRLETARITSSAAELCREIAKAGRRPKVVLEATYGWYWAADALAEIKDRIIARRGKEAAKNIARTAAARKLRGASHYIQEDAPEEILAAISEWWPGAATG